MFLELVTFLLPVTEIADRLGVHSPVTAGHMESTARKQMNAGAELTILIGQGPGRGSGATQCADPSHLC